MREVVSIFQKGFTVGLRKNQSVANSVECLSECYNMIVQPEGIIPRIDIASPVQMKDSFPFPLLFVGAKYILFFTSDAVYMVDSRWDLFILLRHDWKDLPHFADFQDYIVWSTPAGSWQYNGERVTALTEWSGKTCCNYKGQLVMGEAKLPKGPLRAQDGSIIDASVSVPERGTIAWGIIGDINFRYQLGQENGWMTVPHIGEVLATLPMGDDLMAYHQNGIYKLGAESQPLPTFGGYSYASIGPMNRNCVAGDNQQHIFLGSDKRLYRVVPMRAMSQEGRGPENLDYYEYMSQLENPIVTFDRVRRWWYVGDGKKCFVYSGQGLSEVSITPTSVATYMGTPCGSVHKHGTDQAIVTINTTSLNSRAFKTLMAVETDLRADAAEGQVLWRADFSKPLKEAPRKRMDPRGFFFPVVSGSELEVRIITPDFRNTHLSKVWLRYKTTDKVSIRGIVNAGAPQNG